MSSTQSPQAERFGKAQQLPKFGTTPDCALSNVRFTIWLTRNETQWGTSSAIVEQFLPLSRPVGKIMTTVWGDCCWILCGIRHEDPAVDDFGAFWAYWAKKYINRDKLGQKFTWGKSLMTGPRSSVRQPRLHVKDRPITHPLQYASNLEN